MTYYSRAMQNINAAGWTLILLFAGNILLLFYLIDRAVS